VYAWRGESLVWCEQLLVNLILDLSVVFVLPCREEIDLLNEKEADCNASFMLCSLLLGKNNMVNGDGLVLLVLLRLIHPSNFVVSCLNFCSKHNS
jgi:hypothetical protein